jgi:hypothetical protein
MALGVAINAIQRLWASDCESQYSHSGIILDPQGTTFEALWTCKSVNLFEQYSGEQVIIARYTGDLAIPVDEALEQILAKHQGDVYPFWRLLLHLIPPLAKINMSQRPVCSELVAKYSWLIGGRHSHWAGANPDMLADEWRRWDNWEVVFEGTLYRAIFRQ